MPYVYLRGEFVGGYNALDEIERLGQLDQRLLPREERAAGPGPAIEQIGAGRGLIEPGEKPSVDSDSRPGRPRTRAPADPP